MANFKYYEDDYELAVLELLSNSGWDYQCGYDIHRKSDEIILKEDFTEYLSRRYGYFLDDEIEELVSYLTNFSNQSLYRSMKESYSRLQKGYNLLRQDGNNLFIDFFEYGKDAEIVNVFKAVNQYEFEEYKNRRPDIVLFINGIPVSVFELKNPADDTVSIADAYDQTHIRYLQDIPSLMKFDFINVISDGANTRYGSLFSSYEFYFKWNSTDGKNYSNEDGIEGIHHLINGLFNHRTLLNVLTNYFYVPDNSDNDLIILPKYYQYYGAEKMYANILVEHEKKSGKGGTYWGATGCGKSYTMLFLAKRLTMSLELHKPTIVLLTDRNDLDEQLSSDFENAKGFLVDENSISIKDRKMLLEKLENIESGGIYLMTIQKFSEDVNLLSKRNNIICISDEAHRTQTNKEAKYIKSKKDGGIKKTYGFAKYLRDSFPKATYVGFTGTPVDATLRVFGEVVVQYTMKQSLDDGSTVAIARLPGPREVQLDEKMAAACDEYYRLQAEAGANEYQIEQSKKDMTNIKIILGNPDRLDIVVKHFIWHYEKRCEEHATVNGKAMFVCYDREIAFDVYKRIKALRSEWFVKRKCAPEYDGYKIDREAVEIEKVKLVCTNGKNDVKELSDLIGDSKTRKGFAKAFKDDKSNFKIAIVVDMWITGFDVPSLDTMYLDKPIETHNLIQTISRVNRVFKGKEEGLIVDYIGLEGAILTAMKMYNGDIRSINGVDTSLIVFKDFLDKIVHLMHDFDYIEFFNTDITPLQRLNLIQKGVEFVLAKNSRKDNFMGFTQRAKKAFDVCIGHDEITDREVEKLHYFLCVRSVIFKMTAGDTPDTTLMNKKIAELVNKAISSTYSDKEFNFDEQPTDDVQMLFSDDFIEKLKRIPYPNTKYQALVKLLKRAIKEFGKINMLKATEFSKKLRNVIDRYNSRNEISDVEDIITDVVDNLSEELEKIFKELKEEKQSFEDLGITYDEKAFYDILIAVAEKYEFKEKLNDSQYVNLAKEIKKLVGNKSKYTDWTNRQDVKDELYTDVAILLKKNGYPPRTIDDAYDEIMKQVENYKKYDLQVSVRENTLNSNISFVKLSALEAYKLLNSNDILKGWIGKGKFIFAEGYFVIAKDEYVTLKDGTPRLTDNAKRNLSKCVINICEQNTVDYKHYKSAFSGYAYLKCLTGAQHKAVTFHTKNQSELKLVTDELYHSNVRALDEYDIQEEIELMRMLGDPTTSLCNCLWFLMEKRKWKYPEQFNEKTELHVNYHGKIKNNNCNTMKTNTLMAICVGFQLTLRIVEKLFQKSDNKLNYYTDPDMTYVHILELFPGISLMEFNDMLETRNIPRLETKSRV